MRRFKVGDVVCLRSTSKYYVRPTIGVIVYIDLLLLDDITVVFLPPFRGHFGDGTRQRLSWWVLEEDIRLVS